MDFIYTRPPLAYNGGFLNKRDMRENIRNENVSTVTENSNNTNTAQQNEPAELNSANSQGMIYLDIIQPFAL